MIRREIHINVHALLKVHSFSISHLPLVNIESDVTSNQRGVVGFGREPVDISINGCVAYDPVKDLCGAEWRQTQRQKRQSQVSRHRVSRIQYNTREQNEPMSSFRKQEKPI